MADDFVPLSNEEIDDFVSRLDKDNDGCISYTEIEHGLDAAHDELAPDASEHHLHHPSKEDDARHTFLRQMMGIEKDKIPVDSFKDTVRSWNIPSLKQDRKAAQDEDDFLKRLPIGRRLRAYWEVHGPTYCFMGIVIGLQIGLGVWQCVKYATGQQYQAAFGAGVAGAKFFAGALYPTMFFLVLSMSRWTATWFRHIPHTSRFINWDLSQEFHVKMSVVALLLATGHALSHLGGTFRVGSQADRQPAVAALLGPDVVPRPYVAYVRSLPGWSGLTALGLFYTIALLSTPYLRRFSYEIFQLGHLLMFPMLGLLMAHGALGLLQFPVLGLVLASPTLMVIIERVTRVMLGFHKIPASLEVLDDDTVCITATIPKYRLWRYEAGQYVFLQVPQLSRWQWHPFTVSECVGKDFKLHIKTDGDWTSKLRDLDLKYVGIDGPYGAPAQRFYEFDQTIIVGSGIGVTPFSGILRDLQAREDHAWAPRRDSTSSHESAANSEVKENFCSIGDHKIDLNVYRRVDFHWILRERHYIDWFSSLLNKISSGEHNPNLDIRIHNHVTKKRSDIITHVYRYLLERHRTAEHPCSSLTGLLAPTHFGRPDFAKILSQHYEEMQQLFARDRKRKRRVGVFFCGAPIIGEQLADLCHEMTLRGRNDRSEIEYHFQIEVFG